MAVMSSDAVYNSFFFRSLKNEDNEWNTKSPLCDWFSYVFCTQQSLNLFTDSWSLEKIRIIRRNRRGLTTFLLLFDLLYIRHLAADNDSGGGVSSSGVSSIFTLFDEINLEPDFFLFWRRFFAEKTPVGVCIIKTVSGFGALCHK